MDLGDANSPEALVKPVLKSEPNLSMLVPIQELCARLGIVGVEDIDTGGFDGDLVTAGKQSEGTILATRARTASPSPTNSSAV